MLLFSNFLAYNKKLYVIYKKKKTEPELSSFEPEPGPRPQTALCVHPDKKAGLSLFICWCVRVLIQMQMLRRCEPNPEPASRSLTS